MAMFSSTKRKLARETARRLIGGHMTLMAIWTLRQAGVFTAMRQGALNAVAFAQRTAMSEEVLRGLLMYLAKQELVAAGASAGTFVMTPALEGLLEYEAGVLEEMRAYQPVMQALEHLLARLKTYGQGAGTGAVTRRSDALYAGQALRYANEVYPAIERVLLNGVVAGKGKAEESKEEQESGPTHVLDLDCGTGEFLVSAALRNKKFVGVGLCTDATSERQANALISKNGLDRRLIAIAANALEVCMETRRVFERTGISPALWGKLDAVVGVGVFTDLLSHGEDKVRAALMRLPMAFKGSLVMLAEPCAGRQFAGNYYAAEVELLLALSRTELLTAEQWRLLLKAAHVELSEEAGLTDGMTLFVGRCPKSAKA